VLLDCFIISSPGSYEYPVQRRSTKPSSSFLSSSTRFLDALEHQKSKEEAIRNANANSQSAHHANMQPVEDPSMYSPTRRLRMNASAAFSDSSRRFADAHVDSYHRNTGPGSYNTNKPTIKHNTQRYNSVWNSHTQRMEVKCQEGPAPGAYYSSPSWAKKSFNVTFEE
jgi:hypothetical protein